MRITLITLIFLLVYSCNSRFDSSDKVTIMNESISPNLNDLILEFYNYSDSIRGFKSDSKKKKYTVIFYNERDSDFMIMTEASIFDSFPQFLGYDTIQSRLVGFYSFKSNYYRHFINDSLLIKSKIPNEKPSRIEPLNIKYKIEDKDKLIFIDKDVVWFPKMDEN